MFTATCSGAKWTCPDKHALAASERSTGWLKCITRAFPSEIIASDVAQEHTAGASLGVLCRSAIAAAGVANGAHRRRFDFPHPQHRVAAANRVSDRVGQLPRQLVFAVAR